MENSTAIGFSVGERFSSWEEVLERKDTVEKTLFIQFFLRDAKKLESQKKHAPKRVENANPQLVYFLVKLCCHSGGRGYKTKGNGERDVRYVGL